MKPSLEAYTQALALSFAWSANGHIARTGVSVSPTVSIPTAKANIRRIPAAEVQPRTSPVMLHSVQFED